VMVTLGTFQPDAQEQLGGRFGQVVGVAVDAEVVGRAVGVDRTFRGDEFADELVEWFVVAERAFDPVVQRPHPLLADGVALVAQPELNRVRIFPFCPRQLRQGPNCSSILKLPVLSRKKMLSPCRSKVLMVKKPSLASI